MVRYITLGVLALLAEAGQAVTVAGIDVPDTYTASSGPLVLNGAGIRSKFFFDIYVGALYLPAAADDPVSVLAQPGDRRVAMYILYGEVSRDKLVDGWNEGFRRNHEPAAMTALQQRLDQFNDLFDTVRKGDLIELDYSDATGTVVAINGQRRGVVPGRDFNDALLRVWLGDVPADRDLKRAMLGAR